MARLFKERPVAVVFDWDKTLSPVYMQSVLFSHFNVDEKKFWALTHARTKKHSELLGTRVMVEHEYLNTMIDYAQRSIFKDLDNKKLSELGKSLPLYEGVEKLFLKLRSVGAEIYVVSSGIRTMLKDIPVVKDNVDEIYGADFADYELTDSLHVTPYTRIYSVVNAVIPTDKIRILNDISKGCTQGKFDSNTVVSIDRRRIPFRNMIYVGDGVSDIHAFEIVRRGGGYAMAVYNPNEPMFDQAEMLRANGSVDLIAVTDYRPGSTAYDWLTQKVTRLVEQVRQEESAEEEAKFEAVRKGSPKFIHAWSKEGA